MKDANKSEIVLSIVILTISVVIALICIWIAHTIPRPSPAASPRFDLISEKKDDNYILYINACHDPDEVAKLKDIDVFLDYSNNGTMNMKYNVADILNDEGEIITFYDNDNNGRLSVGDEFIIDGDIVNQGTNFKGMYIPQRKIIFMETLT